MPPEKLIGALLPKAFFLVRCEQPLMQQPDDNLLLRWFVGVPMHAPVWDADARLARKSNNAGASLPRGGHVLMENRKGLIAQETVSLATGTAERDSVLSLLDRLPPTEGLNRMRAG